MAKSDSVSATANAVRGRYWAGKWAPGEVRLRYRPCGIRPWEPGSSALVVHEMPLAVRLLQASPA